MGQYMDSHARSIRPRLLCLLFSSISISLVLSLVLAYTHSLSRSVSVQSVVLHRAHTTTLVPLSSPTRTSHSNSRRTSQSPLARTTTGDPSTAGPTCTAGSQGCACSTGRCYAGLDCVANVCAPLGTTLIFSDTQTFF